MEFIEISLLGAMIPQQEYSNVLNKEHIHLKSFTKIDMLFRVHNVSFFV